MIDQKENDQVHYEDDTPRYRLKAKCPIDSEHRAIVKNTAGRTRYCVCLTCGRNFKMVGPRAG